MSPLKDFPESPHAVLDPQTRWLPDDGTLPNLESTSLLPPFVDKLRQKVKEFRDTGYAGATETSRSLLNWWFNTPHLIKDFSGGWSEFDYYFCQREAIETIIYLYDVAKAKDKTELIPFDSSGKVSNDMFYETWRRYVIKMATGSGKTKVLSLVLAWSYFHKFYEEESQLSRNFLVITPNIIVLDRIKRDFDGLKIFHDDPIVPKNGFDGRNWENDFQVTVHLQDEIKIIKPTGNIFLTNIHRVYMGDNTPPSAEDENTMDYFLGKKPTGETIDSKIDLGTIVREVTELTVLNDEAHHIHDPSLAWFKCIQDIHNNLLQKGSGISIQIDVTATPKHTNGAIFVQTVADYPLVEAIHQNVLKRPVLPDSESQNKLKEKQSVKFTERYFDYLNLGVVEWRKAYVEHQKVGRKAILFVMTDDTKNCDEVAEFLKCRYPELKDGVLVIHTKKNGEISESSGSQNIEELKKLREQANTIDNEDNPYKAVVSVMMLKEGWDVRNVTTIVGLRPFSATSKILPEQTLGRGLRRMYPDSSEKEILSVIGTEPFMEFVEQLELEGVELEYGPMGPKKESKLQFAVEVDKDNPKKDIDALDIEIPVVNPRLYRDFKKLSTLEISMLEYQPVKFIDFSKSKKKKINFVDFISGNISHTTMLSSKSPVDFHGVIGYFTHTIMRKLHLFSGYDHLYALIKLFVSEHLFGKTVDIKSANAVQNLSEPVASKTIFESFENAINDLTIIKNETTIIETTKLQNTRTYMAKDQKYYIPTKSVFNKVVGDSQFELKFAIFLDKCPDVESFAKNTKAVNFKLDYMNSDGRIANYYPDFLVKVSAKELFIIETKGAEFVDDPLKLDRLRQWCADLNSLQSEVKYDFVFVDQENFQQEPPKTIKELVEKFTKYKS